MDAGEMLTQNFDIMNRVCHMLLCCSWSGKITKLIPSPFSIQIDKGPKSDHGETKAFATFLPPDGKFGGWYRTRFYPWLSFEDKFQINYI